MPVSKSEAIFYNDKLIPDSIDDVLNVHAQKWIEKLRASLQSNNRVASGSLQSSMIPVVDSSPNYFSLTILSNKYGKFVDKGVSGTKVKYPIDSVTSFPFFIIPLIIFCPKEPPTGATIIPPSLSWSINGCGRCGLAAVTIILS